MIRKVRLRNFQSHKDTEVEFCPGVNVFIGTSDHGKSSVMRALNLVNENKPDGTAFVSSWTWDAKKKPTENAVVDITTDEGTVTRTKGVENSYSSEIDGEKVEYKAFGRGSVPEVQEFLNIGELNVQKQEDNFFLFGESAGEVIRRINSYTNLDLIDQVLVNAERSVRQNRAERKRLLKNLEENQKKEQEYEYLDTLIDLYEKSQEYENRVGELSSEIAVLQDLVTKIDTLQEKIAALPDASRLEKRIARAEKTLSKIDPLIEEKAEIFYIYAQILKIQYAMPKNVEGLSKKIDSTLSLCAKESALFIDKSEMDGAVRHIEEIQRVLGRMLPDIDFARIDRKQGRLTSTATSLESLKNLYVEAKGLQEGIEMEEATLNQLIEEFDEAMGDSCILCGHRLGE